MVELIKSKSSREFKPDIIIGWQRTNIWLIDNEQTWAIFKCGQVFKIYRAFKRPAIPDVRFIIIISYEWVESEEFSQTKVFFTSSTFYTIRRR